MTKIRFIAIFICAVSTSFTFTNTNLNLYWSELLSEANFDESSQSFCIDNNGKISGNNIDLKIKPASVTKLYTTLWSLDTLTKDFRFQTKIIVKDNNLYIIGGSDPFFVTENLFIIMNQLASRGYRSFNKVYFTEDFYLNWSDSKDQVRSTLMNLLNTSRWDKFTLQAFSQMNDYILRNDIGEEIFLPSFKATQIIPIQNIRLMNSDYYFFHKSSPIWQHLKQVNMYSNNFYTDKIFNFLGGSQEFSNYFYKKISATQSEIYFYTGSGLGNNYTTCQTTLNMLNALEEVLEQQDLKLNDIIAVPGIDNGTLINRYKEGAYQGRLVAKTGTLKDTSSLAGYLFAPQSIKFGIFNHTSQKIQARALQDNLIKKAIDNYTNIQRIKYKSADYMSIKDIEIAE